MNRLSNALFWSFAALAAAAGLVALVLPERSQEQNDCLTVVDWKILLHPGKTEEHPFVVFAGDQAWVEIHVEAPAPVAPAPGAPETGGIDLLTTRDAGPVKDLSHEKILGKKTLVGIVPGDVYTIQASNRGSNPASVRIQVVRDYGRY